MRILAVDTATKSCSVAIVEKESIIAETTLFIEQTHSKHLMKMIDTALNLSGLTVSELDGFAVTRGPGSFTGLRIGISSIKGFAMASGKPVVGVSSLDSLAMQCCFSPYLVSPLLDARKGEVYYALILSLIVITFIDIDHQIIPDAITLPGIPIFFFASFTLAAITYKDSLLGILVGGGSLLLIAEIYTRLTKKEGMGGGDIKLLAMIGAALGWEGVLFTIFIGSLIGTLIGIILMLRTHKGLKLAIPFGPFLSMGAISYIFFGSSIINWYLN